MLVVRDQKPSKLANVTTQTIEYEGRTFVSSLLEKQIQVEGEPTLTQKTHNIANGIKNMHILITFGKMTPTTQI